MTQNVITYTVEIITDNSNGRLLPYLTANVQFEISRLAGVLMVPNAALRWTPPAERVAPEFREPSLDAAGEKGGREEGQRAGVKSEKALSDGQKRGVLWIRRGEFLEPLRVKAGLSDGSMTEVQGDGLKEGTEVVLGLQAQATGPAGTANPFIPQFGRGRGGGR
jgi:HlyD family secretion protein